MSGVLVQAALAGKSVVAHEGTLIAALAEQGGIGTVCDVRSPQAVARALGLAVQPDRLAAAQAAGPLSFAAHRPTNAAQAFMQALLPKDSYTGAQAVPAGDVTAAAAPVRAPGIAMREVGAE
jgi:hypothetical protein